MTGEDTGDADDNNAMVRADPEVKRKPNSAGPARGMRHRKKQPMDESQRGKEKCLIQPPTAVLSVT